MLTQLYANNAITTLASSVSPSDTSIQVASAATFPNPAANQYFRVTIDSGTGIEVIFVFGVTGSTFTGCLRGQEGTVAQNFQAGTTIECRVTKGTLEQFARYQDRLADITSVDGLASPSNSDGNSYICASTDDVGNPIVAIESGHATWRFVNHPTIISSGGAQASSTTTKLNLTNASSAVSTPVAGKYIIQFTSGANRGLARLIVASDTTGVTWATPLPSAPVTGDTFEIYQSVASSISSLNDSAQSGLIYAILFSD